MTPGKGEIPFHGWESRCSNSHVGGRWQAGPPAWISRLWALLSPATSSLLTISLTHGWTQSPWATYLPDGVTEAFSPQPAPCSFLQDGVPVTGSFPKARKVLSRRPPSCCQLLQLWVFRDDPCHTRVAKLWLSQLVSKMQTLCASEGTFTLISICLKGTEDCFCHFKKETCLILKQTLPRRKYIARCISWMNVKDHFSFPHCA